MSEKPTDHWSWLASELGATPPPEPTPAEPEAAAPAETPTPDELPHEVFDVPERPNVAFPLAEALDPYASSEPVPTPAPPAIEPTPRPVSDWDMLAEELGIAPPPAPSALPPAPGEPAAPEMETPDRLSEHVEVFDTPVAAEDVGVTAEFAAEKPAEAGEGEERRKRRRRRRRRPRESRERGETAESVESDEEPSVAAIGDLLAEEEEPEPREEAPPPPREREKRRRPGRERGGERRPKEDTFAAGLEKEPRPSRERREADEEDDELAEMRPAHRQIPTWEEAVGFIVSGNMESRSRRSDGGRGRGHRGGRR